MSIEKLVKKLPSRHWDHICSSWLPHIPKITPPGARPVPLTENADLSYWCEQATPSGNKKLSSVSGSVAGLREAIFHEGVYWLHKAVHAMYGSESKIAAGMLTWSVIDGYLAAYFSMRSISAILGVAVCDYLSKSYVVDLCRDFGNMSRVKRKGESAFAQEVGIHTFGVRFDHKQCWQILQRLLRVLHSETWGPAVSQSIYELASTDFAHHRNRISYYVHEWLKDDLHRPLAEDTFATDAIYDKCPAFNTADSAFTIHLAYSLMTVALTAYNDVAKVGVILHDETETFRQALDDSRHPYYGARLMSILSIV